MKKAAQAIPNHQLKHEREIRSWSQLDVADRIGTTALNVSRWERGITFPTPHFRRELCTLFERSPAELGFLEKKVDIHAESQQEQTESQEVAIQQEPSSDSALSASASLEQEALPWDVPYRRNPFFTGREDILQKLRLLFTSEHVAAAPLVVAISGLGGMGKTQLALEYAYRYGEDYRGVFWIQADTPDTLIAGFSNIAHLLQLPEKHEQDQSLMVTAVKRWLEKHSHWLLILDNADDLPLSHAFMPTTGQGHILFTTRTQITGTLADYISLEKMGMEESILFLLRRAKLLATITSPDHASYTDRVAARTIVDEMDGLPLALDQAGAYIEETGCGLAGYAARYTKRRAVLLKRRGTSISSHPHPVATTWSLSFEKVAQTNPAAAALLQLCSFLHPDAIFEELLTSGIREAGTVLQSVAADPLELDAAIETLRMFSLIRRDPDTNTLSIHRLVQEVLREQMPEDARLQWAERIVRALNSVFPEVEFAQWSLCQRCLPHALISAEYIAQWHLSFPEAIILLNKAGHYLRERGHQAEAQQMLVQAMSICEQASRVGTLDTALTLNNLGKLYHEQNRFSEAEALFQRALTIYEKELGTTHLKVAQCLNNLAEIYYSQGKYAQVEQPCLRALEIYEYHLEAEHPYIADNLSLLAALAQNQGKFAQAETLYQRALHIRKHTLGPEHLNVAESLNNLAFLYTSQGKYSLAEPLYQQALALCEKNLGPSHMYTAHSLHNLAEVYREQGKYEEAEHYHRKALEIREQILGRNHSQVAMSLTHLADTYYAQRKYADAESLALSALHIWQKTVGQHHPNMAITLNTLALLSTAQERYAQAESYAMQALEIRQHVWGPHHRAVGRSLHTLAELYYAQSRYAEAEQSLQQGLAIFEQVLAPKHPDTIHSLSTLALIYHAQGREHEAEALLLRVANTRESISPSLYHRLVKALKFSQDGPYSTHRERGN